MDSHITPESEKKWMWVDPFVTAYNGRMQPGALLLAEDIKRYSTEFNLLIERDDFATGKPKGASYSMTPDEEGAWMFDIDDKEKPLEKATDSHGLHYILPKHSLAFIKLKQRLRVPYYMIGRHDLKIKYVYQGLLLGTGPQVDPGYVGQLFIPLHNLTTRPVKVYINESFVSIDFARTMPLDFRGSVPETIDELYAKFGSEKHLIDLDKIKKRVKLADYLAGTTPRSAMHDVLNSYEELRNATKWERIGVIFVGCTLMVSIFALLVGIWNWGGGYIREFENRITSSQQRMVSLERDLSVIDESARRALENTQHSLQGMLAKSDSQMTQLIMRLDHLQKAYDVHLVERERLAKQVEALAAKVGNIERSSPSTLQDVDK